MDIGVVGLFLGGFVTLIGQLLVLGAVPFTGVALAWIALREWRQARVARVDTGPAM